MDGTDRILGPIFETLGFADVNELARVAAHEIGHTLSLPPDDYDYPPSRNDDHPGTTGDHDNFKFPNPEYPNDMSKQVWSIVRSGAFEGEEMQLTEWSRWLRRLYWRDANLEAGKRMGEVQN